MSNIQNQPPRIRLLRATEADSFAVKHFLKQHKQSQPQSDDTVFIVRLNTLSNQSIVGIAKLRKITDTADWLHGVFVIRAWRNHGIAGRLIAFIQQQADVQQFTFPLPHLKHFYLKLDYQLIEIPKLPNALQVRYQNAVSQHKKWLCMSYRNANQPLK